MGWDIELQKDGEPVQVKEFCHGSTVRAEYNEKTDTLVPIPISEADMSITYNYSRLFNLVGVDLNEFNDVPASETIRRLERGVKALGTHRHEDYYADTTGNAGYTLSILLEWARQHPDAVWKVT